MYIGYFTFKMSYRNISLNSEHGNSEWEMRQVMVFVVVRYFYFFLPLSLTDSDFYYIRAGSFFCFLLRHTFEDHTEYRNESVMRKLLCEPFPPLVSLFNILLAVCV